MILPPTSIDSPEELAQLSQFVINIIDFRDPDATMTHWVNPDVDAQRPAVHQRRQRRDILHQPEPGSGRLRLRRRQRQHPLDQYGMEYNPVAINEVLAYSFQSRATNARFRRPRTTNRFFIELVNTLTAAYNPTFNYQPRHARTLTNNYYGYGPIPGAVSTQPTGGNIADPHDPTHQASTLDLGGFSYTADESLPAAAGTWSSRPTTR